MPIVTSVDTVGVQARYNLEDIVLTKQSSLLIISIKEGSYNISYS